MPHKAEDLDTAQIRAFQAARIESLMAKPIFTDHELAEIFGLPMSSYLALKKTLGLEQFKVGKRWFTSRASLLSWIESRSSRSPF